MSIKNKPVILGKQKYKEKYLSRLSDDAIAVSSADYNITKDFPSIDKILECTAKQLNVDIEVLMRYRRGYTNKAKMLAIYACRKLGAIKITDIARKFSLRSHGAVSKMVAKVGRLLEEDGELKSAYDAIKQTIQKVK